MQIDCPACGKGLDWDESSTDQDAASVDCPYCGHGFLLHIRRRKPQLGGLPAGRGSSFQWFVRKRDGTLLSFPDDEKFRSAIARNMVGLADDLSTDGENWVVVGTVPLVAGFLDLWKAGAYVNSEEKKNTGFSGSEGPGLGSSQASAETGSPKPQVRTMVERTEETDPEFHGVDFRGVDRQSRIDAYGDYGPEEQREEGMVVVSGRRDAQIAEDTSEILVRSSTEKSIPAAADPVEITADRPATLETEKAERAAPKSAKPAPAPQPNVEDSDDGIPHEEPEAVFEDSALHEGPTKSDTGDNWDSEAWKQTVKRETKHAEDDMIDDIRGGRYVRTGFIAAAALALLLFVAVFTGLCGGGEEKQSTEAIPEEQTAINEYAGQPMNAAQPAAQPQEPAAVPEANAGGEVPEAAAVEGSAAEGAPDAVGADEGPGDDASTVAETVEEDAAEAASAEPPENVAAVPQPAAVVANPVPAPAAPAAVPAAEGKKPRIATRTGPRTVAAPPERAPEPRKTVKELSDGDSGGTKAAEDGMVQDRMQGASELSGFDDLMSSGDFLRKGSPGKAVVYYEKAVKLHPDRSEAAYKAGDCYFQTKNYDKAIYYFTLAIEKGQFRAAYSRLAQTWWKLGQTAKAREVLDEGLQHFPSDPLMQSLKTTFR